MTAVPGQRPAPATRPNAGHAAEDDLRQLFGQSIAVFAALAGPTHVVEAANPAFLATIGEERARTGVAIAELMPELAEQGFLALLDEVYRTGELYTGRDARVVLGAGAQAREAFFDFTYEPRHDADGAVTGIRVIGVETTQVKHAQRLMAEHRALLEQIARQAPLPEVLDGMARCIENLAPQEVLVSVLLADPDGRHLRHGAAPSLPDFYNQAIDGIATGEGVGSCGTAAHRREPVIVTDIAADPFWDDFRGLAERAGLAACWSTPILARDGSLLGTFAIYHRTPRIPKDTDLALIQVFTAPRPWPSNATTSNRRRWPPRPAPEPPTTSWPRRCARSGNCAARPSGAPPPPRNSRPECVPPPPRRPPGHAPSVASSAGTRDAPPRPRSRSPIRGATRRGAARSTSRRRFSTSGRCSSPARNSAASPATSTADDLSRGARWRR